MARGVRVSNDPIQELYKRLDQAVKEVEGIKKTWTAKSLPFGKIDIKGPSKSDVAAAAEIFDEATSYAVQVVSQAIREALDTAVSSSVWAWNTGGARDIVDTGELKASLSVAINGDTVDISYNTPYASFVHNGGYIQPYGNQRIDAVYLPGRPWIDATLYGNGPVPSVNLDEIIGGAIDSRLR
jgi:phage gpG-like protein